MYKRCIFGAVVTLILLVGCKNNSNVPATGIEIDYTGFQAKPLPTDSILKKVQVIVPETTDSSLIGNIIRLRMYRDILYVLDSDSHILAFDGTGKCVMRLHNIGNGPWEYLNVKDFDIDESDGTIFLLADDNLLKYSQDGKFVEKMDVAIDYDAGLAVTNDYIYIERNTYSDDGEAEFNISVIKRKDNSVTEILPTLPEYAPGCNHATSGICRTGENVWFTRKFDPKIYRLADGEVHEWLSMNFGDGFYIPEADEKLDCSELFSKTRKEKNIYKIGNVTSTDSTCLFTTSLGNCGVVYINNRDVQIFPSFTDKASGMISAIQKPVSAQIPTVAFVMPASNLKIMATISGNREIEKLSTELNEESNPLFFIYELK
ncbi:MAG: 6-bladed beta-propeller [Lachnospiraceae bacterium]|nr:6-bladed beta-propeller [Lachnospiraceae bacterium]